MAIRLKKRHCLMIALSALVTTSVGLTQAASHISPPPMLTAPQVQDAAAPHAFTLQANSRIVLTDVTVTDSKGRPVHGLAEAAFHVFDNKTPQQLNSFVEHHDRPNEVAAGALPTAAGSTYSNAYLLHPPKVLNVILLDTTNLGIGDQMYLNYEMKQFVAKLPVGEPFAVYSQSGLNVVEQQAFTADPALLLAAFHRAIPKLPDPDGQYASDYGTLHQLVVHLSQLPGRKNVLWFSGSGDLGLLADAGDLPPYVDLQPVYDELEASRIALYPIDARGLMTADSMGMGDQQMQQTARTTGGRAVFNTNGLARAALDIAAQDGSYYTLSYAPSDVKFDNKWHRVKVVVDLPRGYTLSYRRGYFDDGANTNSPADSSRMVLNAKGVKDTVQTPDVMSQPIIFSVSVLPSPLSLAATGDAAEEAQADGTASNKKEQKGRSGRGRAHYTIRYTVPVGDFDLRQAIGDDPNKRQMKVGVALVAFNSFGRAVEQNMRQIVFAINYAKLAGSEGATVPFDVGIDLPYGSDSLYAVVWDMTTRRTGSIEMPVEVPKAAKGRP